MRKILAVLSLTLLLSGCGKTQTFETVSDSGDVPVSTEVYRVVVSLPEEASQPIMDSGSEQIYMCENFTIAVQQLSGGDMQATLKQLTGGAVEQTSVIQTDRNGVPCYRLAWAAVGEDGLQSCRSVIMDDGKYHHAVTVMADYTVAGDLDAQWKHILDSVILVRTA